MLKIERGEATRVSPDTMRKLDVCLRWEAGSTATIVAGGIPRPLDERRHRDIAVGPAAIKVPAEAIGQLIRVAREITDLAQADSPLMQAAADRLNVAIQPLYGQYVTELLEANRRQQGALAPLVVVLGEFLDRPISPDDDDWEEAAYRRWLAGMPVTIDDRLRTVFESRVEGGR
ncbi:hypothetical protein [Nocardia sp. BMG111209]|uniref:hypothetical protein n=1 Tax=Nocardia sp. BMG111209 TaxID=1160137 RepID=UPI000361B925|nr:hypothetical protein [Nocardia sp. BMG111209]